MLAIDLGTDMFPAIALGTEPPEAGVMNSPPRAHDDRLLNGATLFRAYLWLGLMESGIAMLLYFMTLREAGWQFGDLLDHRAPAYTQATTTCFASICMVQLLNSFNCRHTSLSIFDHRVKSNPRLLLGTALGAILVAFLIYHPVGNILFGTTPLDYKFWINIIPLTLIFLVIEELRKSCVRFVVRVNRGRQHVA